MQIVQRLYLLLGCLLLLPYLYACWLVDLRLNTIPFVYTFLGAFLLYAVAVVCILKWQRFPTVEAKETLSLSSNFWISHGLFIFLLAAAMMIILLLQRPTLSDDAYRYVWDGRVQAQGISPYRYPPNAAELEPLRDEPIWTYINRKKAITVYPPAAELAFAGLWRIWPDSIRWFQIAMAGCALLAGMLLVGLLGDLGRDPLRVIIYLWSPLLIFETAHGAHVDGLVLPFLIGAWWARVRNRDALVGLLLGLATGMKFYPALLIPALWRPNHRQGRWTMPLAFVGTLIAVYLPYVLRDGAGVLGFLPNYFRERFNVGLAGLLIPLFSALGIDPNRAILLLTLSALGALSLWMLLRPAKDGEEALRRCIWLIGTFTLLTQNLFSWYLLWMLPLIAIFLQPGRWLGLRADGWTGWWLFCGLVGLSYTFFIIWRPVTWALWAQFVPLYLLLGMDLIGRVWRRVEALTIHHSPFTIYHSPFTIHHSPFTIHHCFFSRERGALIVLALAALGTLLIYWFAFVRLFNLLHLYDLPLLDLYKLSDEFPTARWWLIAGFAGLAIFYWLGWKATQQIQSGWAWGIVLGGALAATLILLFLYPIGAADIFDNIFHGRILGVYGANPFLQVVNDFPDDPFFYYTAWRKTPSAYGPLWEMIAGGLARLAGDGIVTAVVVFKLANALFLALAAALVAMILQKVAPQRTLAGVLLFTWNPVILYETIGNGHNDIAMIVCILAAAWLLVRNEAKSASSFLLSNSSFLIVVLVLGVLIKFIPALLLPAAGLIALRRLLGVGGKQPLHYARAVGFILLTTLLAVGVVIFCYAPFWHGWDTLGMTRRQQLFTTSLPAILRSLLSPTWGLDISFTISRVAAVATVVFALVQGAIASGFWSSHFDPSEPEAIRFVRAGFTVFVFYLLLACPWFETWYAIWPLALAALLPPGHAARLGVLFGFTALSKRLIFEPLWLWTLPLPDREWRELRLSLAVLLIPWLYVVGVWLWSMRSRRIFSVKQGKTSGRWA